MSESKNSLQRQETEQSQPHNKSQDEIKEILNALKDIAKNEDFAYPLRNYIFELTRLHDVDADSYYEEFMEFLYFLKSTEKINQDIIEKISKLGWPRLRNILVSLIPYLNLKKPSEEKQANQIIQQSQSNNQVRPA
ncbi:hypothetical protein [Vulcanisaeta distributa]|uniref:Uncharacterized protein n=1 Tax=Vulcanisaeta distributa (strain DSM 14429 / JCM 11212 / NBRC 100878 / IC-017) TaxID=572478 RepID=E1QU74_VULDI|nr:hypothetical protein [Vulcanisaeta distributa]ADN51068.1 hypothetical protein Vdis_1694 [Vulcanisaeta distributa DSM 14429]